jgi:replicative DNA helicase
MTSVNGHYTAVEDRDLTLPPHAIDAEEAVLGSILKHPRAISQVADELEPRDFYDKRHQLIWKAMLAQEHDGEPIDYHLVGERLHKHGDYETSGGLLYLSEINLATPSSAHIVYYAKIVCTYSDYRRLISLSQGLAEGAWRGAKTPQALMDEMQRRMAKLIARGADDAPVSMRQAAETAWVRLERERERFRLHDHTQGEYMAGYKTGLDRLDNVLLGLKPGDLIYLAARTSMGKSILAQQIAMNVANQGGAVYFASLEMSVDKLVDRSITMQTGVLRHELTRGNYTDHEQKLVRQALDRMQELPLAWDATGRTVESIRRRAQRWADEVGPLGLIVVDYVQLLRDQAGPRANRYENVSAASHALKEMAESMHCTVIAPAQVSRQVMNRSSKMPDLSDLRESGDLEQDCDIALGLDRPNYHDRSSEDQTATLAVLKARDLASDRGRGTHVPLAWLPKYERYGDLAIDGNVVPFRARHQILPDDLPATPPPPDDQGDLPF